MLKTTTRSVLSLALVFCLLLGMSGNAIALAAGNPVSNTVDTFDNRVDTVIELLRDQIETLNTQIADLRENTVNPAREDLIQAREDLIQAKQDLEELTGPGSEYADAQQQLEDARAELAKAEAERENLPALKQQMEDALADVQAQLDNAQDQLDNAQVQLDEAQAKLDEVGVELTEKNAELEEVREKLTDALLELDSKRAELEGLESAGADQDLIDAAQEKLAEAEAVYNDYKAQYDDAQEKLGEANQKWQDAQTALDNKQAEKDAAQAEKDAKQAEFDAKEIEVRAEFDKNVEKLDQLIVDARAALADIEAYMDEVDAAVAYFEGRLEKAEQVLEEAEALVDAADAALNEAQEAADQATALVDQVEKTYYDLRNAIVNPEPSLSYIRETVAELKANYKAAWNALLELDVKIDDVIVAYNALAALEVSEVIISYPPIEEKIIEEFGETFDLDPTDGLDNGIFYGLKEDKVLPAIDFSEYEKYSFTADDVPEIPEMPAMLTTLDSQMDNIIAKGVTLNAALSFAVTNGRKVVAKALDVTEEVVGITYDIISENLNREGVKKVYNWLYENPDKVCAIVKEFGLYGLEMLTRFGPYALDLLRDNYDLVVKAMKVLGGVSYIGAEFLYSHSAGIMGYAGKAVDFLMDYKDEVVDIARKLYNKYGDEAKALIMVYVDYLGLEERYADAIHGEYTVYHDSLYLALGDETATGSAEKLAELMGISHMFQDMTEYGMTVGQAVDMVGQQAELIGEADLITLGFSNLAADRNMLKALAGEDVTNWSHILSQTLVDDIEAALELLRERLLADGYGTTTVDEIVVAASAYIYTYAARAYNFPKLVKAIREVNEDALIVIVGSYNELDNVVVEIGGREVNLGSINRFLIKATNVENLLQAMICENVVYASAYEVETVFEANGAEKTTVPNLLLSLNNDELLPSEAGAAYVAEQIYNALDVEYKIWGDVNGDHMVNCRDARLVLMYSAELIGEDDLDLSVADVTGDGKINARDVRWILQLRAELVDHFPVCNLSEE